MFVFILLLHAHYHDIKVFVILISRLPPPSTLEMVVPAHAVGKVMGKGGANIENIRKVSLFPFLGHCCPLLLYLLITR